MSGAPTFRGGPRLLLRQLVAVGLTLGIMLGAVVVVGCEEENVTELFPDMTPPATGTGGIRGHWQGEPSEVVLCSQEWDVEELAQGLVMVNCPGSEWAGSIDASQSDLFFFDGLDAGDYWLAGESYPSPDVPRWHMMGNHGHRVTVREGEWTDVPSP